MRGSMVLRSEGWRRRVLLIGVVAAGVTMLASIAYACILRTGTLLVCSPPSRTYVSGTQCSRAAGTGGQSGLARLDADGSRVSVRARGLGDRPYEVLFRVPGQTSSCTAHDGTRSVSLLGYDEAGNAVTVNGPSFYRRAVSPATATTGRAQICVADPGDITAQTVNVVVI